MGEREGGREGGRKGRREGLEEGKRKEGILYIIRNARIANLGDR